jgi:hypothetical protein
LFVAIQIHLHITDGCVDTAPLSRVGVDCLSNLCAQAGESAGVGDVGAGLVSTTSSASTAFAASTSTIAATASTTEFATAFATTATALAAAEFTAATTASLTTTTATLATAASSTSTALTGRGSEHTVAIELDVDLLLALAFTLSLGVLSGHENLLLLFAGQSLALGELLAAALVGLADVLGGQAELLLSLLNKVGGVGLAPVFGFRLGLVLALGGVSDSLLLLGLGDGVAGLLVLELGVAVVSAPAMSSLLLLLAAVCQ